MTKEEQIELFYQLLSKNFKDIKKKYKQFCFLNHMDYSEDVLQDTVIKVVDIIQKKRFKRYNRKRC